jgi:hypothetical protein
MSTLLARLLKMACAVRAQIEALQDMSIHFRLTASAPTNFSARGTASAFLCHVAQLFQAILHI